MLKFLTEYSLWYLLPGLFCAAGLTWLLYDAKAPWSKLLNRILAGFRFVLFSVLFFLLLGPFIRQVKNFYEKPVFIFATDNSSSLKLLTDSLSLRDNLARLQKTAEALREKGYEVVFRTLRPDDLPEKLNDISFDYSSTNLSGMIKSVRNDFENKNPAGMVLLSDGIFNRDISPLYLNVGMPIHTVGLGDTVRRADVNLKAVFHNRISYLGNKFPLSAEIHHSGFAGREVTVGLYRKGKVIETKKLVLGKENIPQQLDFLVLAEQKGMQRLTVRILPSEGEFTLENNEKDVFTDVLDGREKVLLVAAAPHPDIKTIRAATERNSNYEFHIYIPGVTPEADFKRNEKYDLVIFHQSPDAKGRTLPIVREILDKKTAVWYILGSGTDYGMLNNMPGAGKVFYTGQTDKVIGRYNPEFTKFTFDDEKKAKLKDFPPMNVPFADYRLAPGLEIILHQQVGSVPTKKPLLAAGEINGRKTAVLYGDGIWRWALNEYARDENRETTEELITKVIQYLSTKEDKRKFRFRPISDEFRDGEPAVFETEVYNTIYEKIYGQKIDLSLTNEEGKSLNYSFVNSSEGFKFKLGGLPKGVYNYKAVSMIEGKAEQSVGEFTVRELQIEALNTAADPGLLRQLSERTGGLFVSGEELQKLHDKLLAEEPVQIIRSAEQIDDVLHLKWIFFLLAGLVCLEWFLRKFRGSY